MANVACSLCRMTGEAEAQAESHYIVTREKVNLGIRSK